MINWRFWKFKNSIFQIKIQCAEPQNWKAKEWVNNRVERSNREILLNFSSEEQGEKYKRNLGSVEDASRSSTILFNRNSRLREQKEWGEWGSMNEYIHKRMSECTHSGSKWQVACMNKYKPTVGSLWGSLCSWKAAKTRAPPNVPCLDGVSSSGHSTGSFFTHIREGFPEICASVPYILCSCSPPNTPIYLFGIYRSF